MIIIKKSTHINQYVLILPYISANLEINLHGSISSFVVKLQFQISQIHNLSLIRIICQCSHNCTYINCVSRLRYSSYGEWNRSNCTNNRILWINSPLSYLNCTCWNGAAWAIRYCKCYDCLSSSRIWNGARMWNISCVDYLASWTLIYNWKISSQSVELDSNLSIHWDWIWCCKTPYQLLLIDISYYVWSYTLYF